jgi:hypothetical protein
MKSLWMDLLKWFLVSKTLQKGMNDGLENQKEFSQSINFSKADCSMYYYPIGLPFILVQHLRINLEYN